ncbi:hypothetical protein P7C70_g9563, partial [Phenoliferia sp. Uapishka_3]
MAPPAKVTKPAKPTSKPKAMVSMSSFMPKLNPGSPIPNSQSPSPSLATPPATKKKAAASTASAKGKEKAPSPLDIAGAEEEELGKLDARDELQWVDRYSPTCRDDLGVHPKKVQDVANWLDEAFNPKLAKYRRILVMSGPSGAAKTATLRILAKEYGVEVVEYRNGGNHSFAGDY